MHDSLIKRIVVGSPLAKPIKSVESIFDSIRVASKAGDSVTGHQTIYCISPYKTGTTYLSSAFDSSVAAHEPMQYVSLREFVRNFDSFFLKRLNCLNLKLECSGFFSGYVRNIAANPVASQLKYVCVLREPSKWITSLINYWETLGYLNYDYVNELFWKRCVGVDLVGFTTQDLESQRVAINNLVDFYLDFTEQSFSLKNVDHVPIYGLREYVESLSGELSEPVREQNIYQRKGAGGGFSCEQLAADEKYQKILDSHGIPRLKSAGRK